MPEKTQLQGSKRQQDGEQAIRRLYRSKRERVLAGVCGGVAEFFNVDAVIVRVLWVVSIFIGGLAFAVIPYILGWVIIPENPKQEASRDKNKPESRNAAFLWGLVLIAVGGYFLFQRLDWFGFYPFHFRWHWSPWWFGDFGLELVLAIFLIVVGIVYIYQVSKQENSDGGAKTQKTTGGTQVEKKLTRSVKDRMIGGVCGGVANYFNIDPTIVRIGWAIITLLTNIVPGILAYIVMMIVVPEESAVESKPASKKTGTQKARNKE